MNEKITILYVDDEKINLLLLKINFQKKFNVITALSGQEGLELLRAHPETIIVISDMKMPQMNGIEFIKTAKAAFPHITFFILTGFDITPEIEEAIKNNLIQKYLSKPIVIKEIEESINQVVNSNL
jgi:two-component system response regulator (stage 0 sporulation protein F)